ncbi:MAG: NosD domain-containing protein, partial [Candidatus Altarchaeaceae archaeon]
LGSSSNNTLIGNNASSNSYYGIYLYYSSNNTLIGNNASSNDKGIYLYYSSNNTLTNNNASLNNYGIYLGSSSNNTLIGNNASSNSYYGICLYSSSNNTLINNNASLNSYGIYMGRDSNNNSIISNKLCYNSEYDIYNYGSSTAGNNNTCVTFYNYNDINSTGCNNACPLNENGCNCSSCEECNYKLSHPSCSQVNLIADIINHSGTCINNPENFNNKIFDCQGHKIDGTYVWWSYESYGIYLYNKQNNMIRNCIITDFHHGIHLGYSSNNTLIGNNASSNYEGIHLWNSSNNTLINNSACLNRYGIHLGSSSNNTLIGNNASSNNKGISLYYSSNNILINNTMNNNTYNFDIYGWEIYDFYQDINTSNTVNGKPIYYWTNEKNAPNNCKNAEINESSNAGFVALVGCENITVKNLNLENNSHGILLVNTTNSRILNNTASSNVYGIRLYYSSNNTLTGNNVSSNSYHGIYILSSSNFNKILNNEISNNNETGIVISDCDRWGWRCSGGNSNTTIEGNKISNNKVGISSQKSNSTINSNFVCGNTEFDFNSSDWMSSYGNNNTCDNPDGWNDEGTTGCTYVCAGPGVMSTDENGNEQNVFPTGSNVYCKGWNLPANTQVCIYVVNNSDNWKEGDQLIDESPDGYNTAQTNNDGTLNVTLIWANINVGPDIRYFDIVIDVNCNGIWETNEPIDSVTTYGFVSPIPELPPIVLMIIGIGVAMLVLRWKMSVYRSKQ